MITFVPPPRADETQADFFHRQWHELGKPGVLRERLAEMDRAHAFRRLYIMGCGRSGTWLLTALFATFANVEVVATEVPVQHFGPLATDRQVLVLKRNNTACQTIREIPDAIEIAMMVRHPFAVLTSHNPTTERLYHIDVDRWLSEMRALKHLVDTKRPGTMILRYEDLVGDPAATQVLVSRQFGLTIQHAAADVHRVFEGSPEAVAAMHGLRPIDTNSLDRYRQSAEKMSYLRSIRPQLGPMLDWVSDRYGYDISL